MGQQLIPHVEFDHFVLKQIPRLIDSSDIIINYDYQRGDIWKLKQKIELIKSINSQYSIGVTVVFVNNDSKYEVLDGQQRFITIYQYMKDKIPLANSDIEPYSTLNDRDKAKFDAYCIFYLELIKQKNRNTDDIVQTFLRLQEGTPLNKAEKINAYRSKYKDAFCEIREEHQFFRYLGKEKRFRWRQLSAEMLLIELEGNFKRRVFPDLNLPSLITALEDYEKIIPQSKVREYKSNLDFLVCSLNIMLEAFTPREAIAFYLLTSYLRKFKANTIKLKSELNEFAHLFLKNLNSFSMYQANPPKGMSKKTFNLYKKFKEESKILTTSDSLSNRLDILLAEFKRLHPFIMKDPKRLFEIDQKRELYFCQKGICPECGRELHFNESSGHHIDSHASGGRTDDLTKARLLHQRCHIRLEKRLKKT